LLRDTQTETAANAILNQVMEVAHRSALHETRQAIRMSRNPSNPELFPEEIEKINKLHLEEQYHANKLSSLTHVPVTASSSRFNVPQDESKATPSAEADVPQGRYISPIMFAVGFGTIGCGVLYVCSRIFP